MFPFCILLSMDKTVLLASFIFKDRLDWFLTYLESSFQINKNAVFLYDIEDDTKVMVTFKLLIKGGTHINFKKVFPNATLIHKKGNAIYSINALNKLIETYNVDNICNINYKSVIIDWSNYQDNLLLIKNNNLVITPIKRIL
jgi:hypothetical protein